VTTTTTNQVETTTRSPLKIKVRRLAKARSVHPSPVVAKVDAFPTHPRVPLANARREAPLQATEMLKEFGSGAPNAVVVSDLNSGTITLSTADTVAGAVPESQGPLTDTEMESEVEPMQRTSRKRLAPIAPQTNPSAPPSWTWPYRKYIEERGELLERQFTGVSETLLRRLEDAEKTRGGPKGILAKVTTIAHNTFSQQASDVFKDDNADGAEYSQDILECIRRVMLVEARIRESSKTALKTRTLSEVPPGGLLGVMGAPGESIPAMAGLRIDQYSNAMYWQFAPYLEPVRCVSRSRIC